MVVREINTWFPGTFLCCFSPQRNSSKSSSTLQAPSLTPSLFPPSHLALPKTFYQEEHAVELHTKELGSADWKINYCKSNQSISLQFIRLRIKT